MAGGWLEIPSKITVWPNSNVVRTGPSRLISRVPSAESKTTNDAVREFFDQWALYRRISDENYLRHREATAALSAWLDGRRVRTFLDLGCGDALSTTGVLAGRGVEGYVGVDISPVALDLAKSHALGLGCSIKFVQGDFSDVVCTLPGDFDVVYIGLSLHHLDTAAKARFFRDVLDRVAAGGAFVFFEPMRIANEDLPGYLERFMRIAKRDWTKLSPQDLDKVAGHVLNYDLPETAAGYSEAARQAGFGNVRQIFTDPDELYSTFVCERS